MGIHYLDEYSLSHFIAGIILHRTNIPRLLSYGLHIFFEIFENYIYVPYFGGRCIRIEYLLPIPDCKTIPDTTKNIIGFAKGIVEKHGGKVPRTIEELTALPGVGRKTANVILGNAFGINEGVVVDTHVKRISNLLALTREANPEKVEKDLMQLFPQDSWTLLSHLLIFHGREVCFARRPQCQLCMMSDLCPSAAI